jgi:competence protein ComGC
MKKRNIKIKIISGVLMTSMITSSNMVFASSMTDISRNMPSINMPSMGQGKNNKDMFKAALAKLVTAGTITSAQQSTIETALSTAKGDIKTALSTLVTTGIITSDQKSAIETAFAPQGQSNSKNQGSGQMGDQRKNVSDIFKTALTDLVNVGSITSDQLSTIETAFTPQDQNNGKNQGRVQDKEQGQNPSDIFKTTLANLVTAGTITSNQQSAIETAISTANVDIKTALSNLVTAGTITSDQLSSIENSFAPKDQNNNQDQGRGQDRDQNTEQAGNPSDMFKTALASLVTAGTITSNQQSAIETAISTANVDIKTALSSLVTAGTITSDQLSSIENSFIPKDQNNSEDFADVFKSALSTLVAAGTITSDQQSSIETAISNSNSDLKTALANLVTAGTITSDQLSSIKSALVPENSSESFDSTFKTILSNLVTAGSLTSDQASAIETALTSAK